MFAMMDEAAVWFADLFQSASTLYGVEFGANIAAYQSGYILTDPAVGSKFNERGLGYTVDIRACSSCSGWIHTHPNEATFSSWDLYFRPSQAAYVSMPSGTIDRYTRQTGISTVRRGND